MIKLIKRSFTWPKLIGGFFSVAIIGLLRYGYYGEIHIDFTAYLSNTFWGSSYFILKSLFNTLLEDLFSWYKLPMYILDNNLDNNSIKITKPKRYLAMNMDKGKGIDTSNNNEGSSRSSDNSRNRRSTTPIETDNNYWEAQCKIFRDGLSSLNKPNKYLSEDELYAKKELLRLNLYSEQQMVDALNENQRNLNFPTDEESLRLQNVLNKMSRDAETQTDYYKYKQAEILRKESLIKENQLKESSRLAEINFKEKSIIKDSIVKLKKIAEYNEKYKASVSADSSIPGNPETKLSKTEIDLLVDTISKDKYASLEVRSRIFNKSLHGKINSDSALIEYLEKKSK